MFKETIKFILLVAVIVIPIRFFIAQPFVVNGRSMDPTLETGHYLIVDQVSYKIINPKRGDVIVLKYPKNPSTYFIKRIIGLPGETVEVKKGIVTIYSEKFGTTTLNESYVSKQNELSDSLKTKLTSDEYFVMGDNRAESMDSRSWGPLPEKYIVGRAFIRLFPFSKIGIFPGKTEYDKE